MQHFEFPERKLDDVIEQYLRIRSSAHWPMSINKAVVAVRSVARCDGMSDRELGEEIARRAVAKNRSILFDLGEAVTIQ